ncbi:MAG: NlpC/P60 family protein [Candidatus Melainabacteria bacterium]|nr:NlpC/P60 family protein [Candidatus Melainabacteria bacterium]
MANWNSLDDNSNRRSSGQDRYAQERYGQDTAYQNGAFQDYALPVSYRGDNRNNLAMSVSLGPIDMILGGRQGFDYSGHNNHHRYQHDRYQQDRWQNNNHRFDGSFVSRPYLTPDYSFRKGYEDFGESSYIQQRGWLPQGHRQQYLPEPQDWRMQQRRAQSYWDTGAINYDRPCPPEQEYYERQPRRQSVEIEVAPRYRRETVERQPEVEQREPTRTLPTNAMSEYDWAVYQKLCQTAESLVGKHTTAYDNRLPSDRLGCVKAASLLLDQGYGLNTNEINTRQFEKELREENGFTEVAIADLKPGDVILGYRAGGDYSHAAVYMGNGKIFNNDSDLGTMAIQSVDKFNSTEFKRITILRRPAKVPSVPAA